MTSYTIPEGIDPVMWIEMTIDELCVNYGLLARGKKIVSEILYDLYEESGVFDKKPDFESDEDWNKEISKRSEKVNIDNIKERIAKIYDSLLEAEDPELENLAVSYRKLLERITSV